MTGKIDIVSERIFPVDVKTLFSAFAEPEKLCDWWGPHGFTNRIEAFDLRPGGEWRITMIASNGTGFDNRSTFEVVEPCERIVFVHHEPIHIYRMEMTFLTEAKGARLTWRMSFDENEELSMLAKFIAAANEQNFDRLQAFLERHTHSH